MNFPRNTFPGNTPIRIFRYNIPHHLETFRKEILQIHLENVRNKKLDPAIKYVIGGNSIKIPYSNEKKQIVIQELYLTFVWCVTYFMLIVFEGAIAKKMREDQWVGEFKFDTPLLLNAYKLFVWALSLTQNISAWSLDLPNPEKPNNEEEKYWVEKVNGIFLDAVINNILHEYAHIVNGHFRYLKNILKKNISELTDEEKSTRIEIENEADNFARELLVKNSDSEKYKMQKGLALIISHIAPLFIYTDPKSLRQEVHPDIDVRIINALEYLNFEREILKDYLLGITTFSLKVFLNYHRIDISVEPQKPGELLMIYLKKIEEVKNYDRN